MKGIEDTLAEVVDPDFLAADTGVKHALFRFTKMVLNNTVYHGLINELIHNSFERWNQSDVFVNKLSEDV